MFCEQKQQNSLIAGLRATNELTLGPLPDHTEEKAKEVSVDRESEADLKVEYFPISPYLAYGT